MLVLAMPYPAAAGPAYEGETTALLARMTVQPDSARKDAINTLVLALKNGGLWALLGAFYIFAAHDVQAARLNWKGSSYDLAQVGSVTFDTDLGFTGDGATGYHDGGYVFGVGEGVQDSAHLGVYSRTGPGAGATDTGNSNSIIACRTTGNTMAHRCNSGTTTTPANLTGLGHFVSSRTASNATQGYRNAAALGAVSTFASGAPDAVNSIRLGGRSGTVGFSARQLSAAHMGAGLSATDVSNLYNAVQAYMTTVGANV